MTDKEKLNIAMAALLYYTNEDNYCHWSELYPGTIVAEENCGDTARTAIRKIKEE
ncbi:MAG: hypothetical protein RSD17_07775 [Oscillospiraceae bacterium]